MSALWGDLESIHIGRNAAWPLVRLMERVQKGLPVMQMSKQTLSQVRLYELSLIGMTTLHKRVDEGYEYGLVFM